MALKPIVPESVGGRASFASPGFRANTESADATGRGALLFTAKLDEIASTEATLDRMTRIAQGRSDLVNDLDRKRIELASDPDISGRESKFQSYAQERYAQLAEGMDRKTAKAFMETVNPIADSMSTTVRHQARTDTVEKAIVTMRSTNDALVAKAGDARNPNERQSLVEAMDSNLKEAFDNGWLTPAQYQAEKKATLTKVDQAEALRLIRTDPSGMVNRLGSADFLPNLDPVTRQNLIDKAGAEQLRRANLAYTQQARAEIAERRALKVQGTEAMKIIIDKNETGELTEGTLQTYRGVLDENQWKAARGMLRGGATEDSKDSLMPLETGIGSRDMTSEINNALGANRITMATYRSLMSRNDAALKDDQPASPYRRGREQVLKGLEPGAMLSGSAADIQRQALVNALREYDEFALGQGPQKLNENPSLALDRSRDIITRYSLINFDQMTQAIGIPRFVDKPRIEVDETALNEAGRRTLEEFDRGALTAAERDTNLRKLEAWTQILKQRAANAVPSPAQGDRPK